MSRVSKRRDGLRGGTRDTRAAGRGAGLLMDVGDLGVLAIINQGLSAQLMVESRIGFGILRKTKECRPGSRWASTNGRRGSRLGCWLSFQHEVARRGIYRLPCTGCLGAGLPWCWPASLLCLSATRVSESRAGLPIAPSSPGCWAAGLLGCGAAVLRSAALCGAELYTCCIQSARVCTHAPGLV